MTQNPFELAPDDDNQPMNEDMLAEGVEPIELDMEEFDIPLEEISIVEIQAEIANGHFENLVPSIDDEDFLMQLGLKVVEGLDSDIATRQPLETTLKLGFENLNPSTGNNGDVPFEGACDITHPIIRENAVKYQAKFSKSLLPVDGPARIDVKDTDSPEAIQAAVKHQRRFNRLLRNDMPEFIPNTERMFLYLPLTGTGIKKVYFDPSLGRPVSEFVRLENFVISDLATDFVNAARYSHIIQCHRNDLKKAIFNGTYVDVLDEKGNIISPSRPDRTELGEAEADAMDEPDIADDTEVFTLVEQYVDLEMTGTEFEDPDGIARPYVVTVDRDSHRVLNIRRNWEPDDDYLKRKIVNFVKYPFVPGIGFYGMGFFHLLNDFQKTLTAITRALVDSASFANLQGGFKKKGIRLSDGQGPLSPGEFRDVDTLGENRLSDVIMPLPFKEPSGTLFNMMKDLSAQAQKFADNAEQVTNESVNYGKVGTTMALMEESQQFFSSIFARVYQSMQLELNLIADLCDKYMPDEPDLRLDLTGDGRKDIGPATDPNYPTRSHMLNLAQSKLNLALQAPQIHDLREAFKNFYQSLGESDEQIKRILPELEQAQPNDPLTDIQMASMGKPIKAFPGQEHDAHIAVKSSFMQDPNNQNPLMAQAMPIIQANIREHMILKYVEQVQGTMQQQQMAGEVGMAQAAQQVLQANQAMAQQGGPENPEMIYAQAEMKKADAMVSKNEGEKIFKTVDLLNDAARIDVERVREQNRTLEAQAKLGIDAAKVDGDLMYDEMSLIMDALTDNAKSLTKDDV